MADIKSISQQSIHSMQSAPAESTQKTSEIVKENRPAEFRPLTKEQKEDLKQTRNAENKFAETAIKAQKFFPFIRFGNPSPPDDFDSREEEYVVADGSKEGNKKQAGVTENKSTESSTKLMTEPWPKLTSGESHVAKHEMEAYYAENPAEKHLASHATEAYYAEHPGEDHVSKHIGEAYGKGDFSKAGAAAAKDSEFTKAGSAKDSELLPIGT